MCDASAAADVLMGLLLLDGGETVAIVWASLIDWYRFIGNDSSVV
jgi:hypothetical protein